MHRILVIRLYFSLNAQMLYMFWTVLVHLQEQLYKLYIAFGICRYNTYGCCVAIATYRHIPNAMYSL